MNSSKRFEWIDSAKVIAIFLIVVHHLLANCSFGGNFGSRFLYHCIQQGPLAARVSFFFLVSGYFLSRNISWTKAVSRFIYLLAPLFLWNVIAATLSGSFEFNFSWIITKTLGLNALFNRHIICIFGSENGFFPFIGPSWFLRDLCVLALVTPLICNFRSYIPYIVAALCFYGITNHRPDSQALLSPFTIIPYALGCYLSTFTVESLSRIFNTKMTVLLILCSIGALAMLTADAMHLANIPGITRGSETAHSITFFGALLSVLFIAHCGVLIERHLPKLSSFLSSLAPASFLVFVLHMPLMQVIQHMIPEEIWNSHWVLLVPFGLYAAITLLHNSLVKFVPYAAPYLCNTKPTAARK